MAMFRKAEPQPPKTPRAVPTPRGPLPENGISIIGTGMVVVGDIETEGSVRIEGEVRGTIRAGKSVVLGQGGRVEGDIITEDAVIGGSVEGAIMAGQRLELQSTSVVSGEVHAPPEHLKLEEGARFTGHVRMENPSVSGSGPRLERASNGQPRTLPAPPEKAVTESPAAEAIN